MNIRLLFATFSIILSSMAASQVYDQELFDKMSPVVKISNLEAMSVGVGFFVNTDTGDYIFTNAHVCMGVERFYKRDIGLEKLRISQVKNNIYITSEYDLREEHIDIEEDFCSIRVKSVFYLTNFSTYNLGVFDPRSSIKTVDLFKNNIELIPSSRYRKDYLNLGDDYSKITNRENSYIFDHWCRKGMSGSPILNKGGEVVAMASSCVRGGSVSMPPHQKMLEGRSLNWITKIYNEKDFK